MRVSLRVLARFPTLLVEPPNDHLSAFLDLRVNEVSPPLEHVSSLVCVFGSVVDSTENHRVPTGFLQSEETQGSLYAEATIIASMGSYMGSFVQWNL